MAAKKDLWPLSDEMTVLESVIDFKQQFNKDAATNRDAFFNFVKGKLRYPDFTKRQVMRKLKKLKNKYKNRLKESSLSLRLGFTNLYDAKCFKLSKEIWGSLPVVVEDRVKKEKDFRQLYPHLTNSLEAEDFPKDMVMPLTYYLNNVDGAVLEEWDTEWKKVRLAETQAYLRKLDLIKEHTTWILNQMKSSG